MEEKEEDRDSNWEAPEFKREALLRESSSWVLWDVLQFYSSFRA